MEQIRNDSSVFQQRVVLPITMIICDVLEGVVTLNLMRKNTQNWEFLKNSVDANIRMRMFLPVALGVLYHVGVDPYEGSHKVIMCW